MKKPLLCCDWTHGFEPWYNDAANPTLISLKAHTTERDEKYGTSLTG